MTSDESDANGRECYLILMRHAKSDWGDASLSDRQRPLNDRGRRDAPRMAQWLESVDMVPDLVLSSSSQRTRETAQLMLEQWSNPPEISFSDTMYLASPDEIVETAQCDGGQARRLMMLAHNPGMAYLVSGLSGQSVDMPTAAIAIFQVTLDDWCELRDSQPVSLVHFMRPKAL